MRAPETTTGPRAHSEGAAGDSWRQHASIVGASERYELLGELATGGMATVYLGRMRRPRGFSRLVAVKAMHPQYAKDPSFASMFVDEARLTARLRHPNIVPTLDIVEGDGQLLIVMEYVEGESLSSLVRLVTEQKERIPVPIACAIVHDALLGLHDAHEAKDDDGAPLQIVHRDVSPQNVLVGVDGLARVLDFGVAKARRCFHSSCDGEIKGKVPYMPPEQLFGEELDRRVDVYAAGVLLWEALTCARLFDGSSEEVLVQRIADGAVVAPSTRAPEISRELDAVVARALSRERSDRFATALAMAEAIASLAPLPPRTEVAAFMRRFARPREIPPTTPRLETREETTTDAGAVVVAALERASTAAPLVRKRRWATATVVAATAAVAALAVLAGGPRAGSVAARPETSAEVGLATPPSARPASPRGSLVGSSASSAPTAIAAPEPSPHEPLPTTSPSQSEPSRSGERRAASAARAELPKRAVEAKSPDAKAAAATAGAEPKGPESTAAHAPLPNNCRLPYVVDDEGHRHYKVECL